MVSCLRPHSNLALFEGSVDPYTHLLRPQNVCKELWVGFLFCLHRGVLCRKGLVEEHRPVQGHWLGSCRHVVLRHNSTLRVDSSSGRGEMKNSIETCEGDGDGSDLGLSLNCDAHLGLG